MLISFVDVHKDTDLLKNMRLRRALARAWKRCDDGDRLRLTIWCVSEWGGIRSNAKRTLRRYAESNPRADRLLRKLAPNTNESADHYVKPKGMHWRILHTICGRLDAAQGVANIGLYQSARSYFGLKGLTGL